MFETVLVIGGNGSIGGWVTVDLLKRVRIAHVSEIVELELGTGAKVPTRARPDVVLRIVAPFQRPMRFVTPLPGRKHASSSAAAQAVPG